MDYGCALYEGSLAHIAIRSSSEVDSGGLEADLCTTVSHHYRELKFDLAFPRSSHGARRIFVREISSSSQNFLYTSKEVDLIDIFRPVHALPPLHSHIHIKLPNEETANNPPRLFRFHKFNLSKISFLLSFAFNKISVTHI